MRVVEAAELSEAMSASSRLLSNHPNGFFKTIDTPFGDLPLRTSYRDTKKYGWWQDLLLLKYIAAFNREFSDAKECFEQKAQDQKNVTEFLPKTDSILEELFLRMTCLGFVPIVEKKEGVERPEFRFVYNREKHFETSQFLSSVVWRLKHYKDSLNIFGETMAIDISFHQCRRFYENMPSERMVSARQSFKHESSQVYRLDYGNRDPVDSFLSSGYVSRDPNGNFSSTFYGCLTLGFFIDAYHHENIRFDNSRQIHLSGKNVTKDIQGASS